MAGNQWDFIPESGGIKIKENIKKQTEKRIIQYAETNLASCYTRLDIRFRNYFCYVDAYTEPEVPDGEWPDDFPETREEYVERLKKTPYHLFRLRFYGDEEKWGLAFYSYSSNKYETSVYPTGEFFGTPETALETAAEFYL